MENPHDMRHGEIVISATDPEISPKSIMVFQNNHPPILDVSTSDVIFTHNSEERIFTIQNLGGGMMEWEIATGGSDWLIIDHMSGTNDADVTIDCAENDSGDRAALIVIAGISYIVVSQFARPRLVISSEEIQFDFADTLATLQIQNGGSGLMDWSIEEDIDWLDVSTSSGVNDATIEVVCQANDDIERQGNIVITAPESDISSISIVVTQASGKPILEVESESITLSRLSDNYEFSIINSGSGNLIWQVSSNANWLEITPDQGINDGVITIIPSQNGGDSVREAELTIMAENSDPAQFIIPVVQDNVYGGVESIDPDEAEQGEQLSFTITGREADFRFLTDHGWSILQKDEAEIHGRITSVNTSRVRVNFSVPNSAVTGFWTLDFGSHNRDDRIVTPDVFMVKPR